MALPCSGVRPNSLKGRYPYEKPATTSIDKNQNVSELEEVGTVRIYFFLFQRHIVACWTLGDLYLAMKIIM